MDEKSNETSGTMEARAASAHAHHAGDGDTLRFNWTRFYEAVADSLLGFQNRRKELVAGIHAISSKVDCLSNLQDKFADGSSGPLKDICPFTAMGTFNRRLADDNRKFIANELASLLGVSEPVPDSFDGIPILYVNSWFFDYDRRRRPDDIDTLWEFFAQAIAFAESDNADTRSTFVAAYDNTLSRRGVGRNLAVGLHWIRPWNFPSLDGRVLDYLNKKHNIQIGRNGPKGHCNANDYLMVRDTLKAGFHEDAYPVHSFPGLALAAWRFKDSETSSRPNATIPGTQDDEAETSSLVQSRDMVVKQRMMALNKIHAMFVLRGLKLKKERLIGKKKLLALDFSLFTPVERIELTMLRDLALHLTGVVNDVSRRIEETTEGFEGCEESSNTEVIFHRSAVVPPTGVGDIDDFADADKPATHVGVGPHVDRSNETDTRGRVAKRRDDLRRIVDEEAPPRNLAAAIRSRFSSLGGAELDLPAREPMREPPKFD